ncbi:MAG: hypothetical protein RIB59_11145, partial [Rhodospirillales bacterium]
SLSITSDAYNEVNQSREKYSKIFVIIPNAPVYGNIIKIVAQGDAGREIFYCCQSITGKYGRPYIGEEINPSIPAKVFSSDGKVSEIMPDKLGLFSDDFLLALRLFPGSDQFSIKSLSGIGGATELSNVKKIRRISDRANQQFRDACLAKNIPCFLMIYHNDIFASEDEAFISAFYGDLTAVFSRDPKVQNVDLHYGLNGIWSPEKHRTTSAACYVRNAAKPVVVHNIWAKHKLPEGIFKCTEYVPKEDGTFSKIEN